MCPRMIVGLLFMSTLVVGVTVALDACACGLTNIALGKMAVQSSTYDINIAELAVDANSNSHMNRNRCSATGSNDLNPWWAVDLAAPYVVTGVKLVLRDEAGYRLNDFKVGLTNENPETTAPLTGPYELCYQHPGAVADNAVIDVKCKDGVDAARYLFVATSHEFLTICELYAYGSIDVCADGISGCSPDASCQVVNGAAVCTCNDGFVGDGKTCNSCASGYERYEGSCYRFVTLSPSAWGSAADQCSSEGSHLVYVETSDEESYLLSTAQSVQSGAEWWIGGRREDPPSAMTFVWKSNAGTTAKNMNYQAWCSGEPNNTNNNEYCATLHIPCQGWNDLKCDASLSFICEFELI